MLLTDACVCVCAFEGEREKEKKKEKKRINRIYLLSKHVFIDTFRLIYQPIRIIN